MDESRRQIARLERQLQDSEQRAASATERAVRFEEQLRSAEAREGVARGQLREVRDQLRETEGRLREAAQLLETLPEARGQLRMARDQLRETEGRLREAAQLLETLPEARGQLRMARDQLRETEGRLREATQLLETLREAATDERIRAARLEERLEASNVLVNVERATTEAANAREAAANAREAVTHQDARYFAQYGIQANAKLLEMHERWNSSHGRSIENPQFASKRPVVALLDASRSGPVRRRHKLPSTEYPRVFKIVEGEEHNHVRNELKKLRKENCEVLVPSTYYPNGITLRDSVRKRLGDWTQQQLDKIEIVEEEVSEYVRYGVFAFRVERRELRNRSIVVFFREIVEDLLKTPDNDLRSLTEEAFVPRAEPYAASP